MFNIGHINLNYLSHPYNCGTGKHKTERCIEIPLALYWLDKINNPYEIGAVLPYYKNNLIHEIVDPVDPKATIEASLFDCDFTGMDVLSISTIEHIHDGSYGIVIGDYEQENPSSAFDYIAVNSRSYLITFPYGCCNILDKRLLDDGFNCNIYMLSRQANEEWIQVDKRGLLPYGGNCGNSVIALTNTNIFN